MFLRLGVKGDTILSYEDSSVLFVRINIWVIIRAAGRVR